MLIRYRWYRIKLPCELVDFLNLVAGRPLTQESSCGFSLIDGAFGISKIRFLWRTTVVVTRFDAEGSPIYEAMESISFTDFAMVLVDGELFLRIENPGRTIRDLLNALELLVGLGFTSKPLTFEKTMPVTIFEHVEVSKLVGLKIIDAVIHEDLVASMSFTSKQGMVIESMKPLDGLRYKIASSMYDLVYEGVRGQVAFSLNGMVKVSGQLAPRLLSLIECDLPRFG